MTSGKCEDTYEAEQGTTGHHCVAAAPGPSPRGAVDGCNGRLYRRLSRLPFGGSTTLPHRSRVVSAGERGRRPTRCGARRRAAKRETARGDSSRRLPSVLSASPNRTAGAPARLACVAHTPPLVGAEPDEYEPAGGFPGVRSGGERRPRSPAGAAAGSDKAGPTTQSTTNKCSRTAHVRYLAWIAASSKGVLHANPDRPIYELPPHPPAP